MSGPKETHIRLSPARRASQLLRHLVPGLQDIEAAAVGGEADDGIVALGASLKALLVELAQFRAPVGDRSGALCIVHMAEEALNRCEARLREAPDAREAADVRSRIEALMQGGTRDRVEDMRARAESVLARWGKVAGARAEAREALRAVRQALKALQGGAVALAASVKVEDGLRAGLRTAAVSAIDAEFGHIASCAADAFGLGGLDRSAHAALLDRARRAADAGDFASAAADVDGARRLREAAVQAGTEARERVVQRGELACRLANALESRNYDQVQAYYKDGEPGGDTAPLVLYANSPAGKGHVRVTLAIDGSMVVEVDGVSDGEEDVCLDVLKAFAQVAAGVGDELVVDNYGRAARIVQEVQPQSESQASRQLETDGRGQRQVRSPTRGETGHRAPPPQEKRG